MQKYYYSQLFAPKNKLQNCLLNPNPFPEKYAQNITLVTCCQLYIYYESNKHILKIFLKKLKNEVLVTPVAIESL